MLKVYLSFFYIHLRRRTYTWEVSRYILSLWRYLWNFFGLVPYSSELSLLHFVLYLNLCRFLLYDNEIGVCYQLLQIIFSLLSLLTVSSICVALCILKWNFIGFNEFVPMHPFSTHLKHQKTLWFSYVLKG